MRKKNLDALKAQYEAKIVEMDKKDRTLENPLYARIVHDMEKANELSLLFMNPKDKIQFKKDKFKERIKKIRS